LFISDDHLDNTAFVKADIISKHEKLEEYFNLHRSMKQYPKIKRQYTLVTNILMVDRPTPQKWKENKHSPGRY